MQEIAVSKSTTECMSSGIANYFDFCPNYKTIERYIPDQNNEFMPGIKWGHYCQLYTPAFWKFMYLAYASQINAFHHRLGSNIIEEVVACLLGGYGMPSEIGLMAFKRLKKDFLITPGVLLQKLQKALSWGGR